MRYFRILALTACLSAVSFAWAPIVSANQSSSQSKAAEMEQLRAALGDRTMMDIMEIAAKKDPSYMGPAYLFPVSRLMIRKSYLPYYFDAIDHFHETTAVTAKFTVGKGDQTQNLTPMNIGNAILFTSTNTADKPINEKLWGSFTSRQLFEAFDVPKIHYTDVKISYPGLRGKQLEVDTSLSPHYVVISAKDEAGLWIYSLEMQLDAETPMISFKTQDQFESYRIEGMKAEDVVSIQVNNKAVYTKPRGDKPSVALREELDFTGPTPKHK